MILHGISLTTDRHDLTIGRKSEQFSEAASYGLTDDAHHVAGTEATVRLGLEKASLHAQISSTTNQRGQGWCNLLRCVHCSFRRPTLSKQ